MNHKLFTQEQAREILSWVEKGMPVFDSSGTQLGTVNDIQFASTNNDILSKTLEFFRLPFDQQMRLNKIGYIQIDRGLLDHDCFVTPDQVDEVHSSRIVLNVEVAKLTSS